MYLKEEKQSTKEKQSAKENYAIIETSSEERRIDMAFFRVN